MTGAAGDNASFRHAAALRDLAARAEGVQDPLVVALASAVEGAADTITELRTILDATRGAGQRLPDDDRVDHVAPAWWKRQLYRLAAPRVRPGSRLDRVVRWLEQHP